MVSVDKLIQAMWVAQNILFKYRNILINYVTYTVIFVYQIKINGEQVLLYKEYKKKAA